MTSFRLLDLVELVLRLFVVNTSKFNQAPHLQAVCSVKSSSLKKFRIANITFHIFVFRSERFPLTA